MYVPLYTLGYLVYHYNRYSWNKQLSLMLVRVVVLKSTEALKTVWFLLYNRRLWDVHQSPPHMRRRWVSTVKIRNGRRPSDLSTLWPAILFVQRTNSVGLNLTTFVLRTENKVGQRVVSITRFFTSHKRFNQLKTQVLFLVGRCRGVDVLRSYTRGFETDLRSNCFDRFSYKKKISL